MLKDSAGSRKKFEQYMKKVSSEFDFEYFTSKVISLVKIIMFSKDINSLPFYLGRQRGTFSPNVIDIAYSGALGVKNFYVEDGFAYIKTTAFLEVWYEENGKITMKKEKYMIDLCKNVKKPINFNFSIKKIQCKQCGSSFDATKEKDCPYCHNEYSLKDEDWTILSIIKI